MSDKFAIENEIIFNKKNNPVCMKFGEKPEGMIACYIQWIVLTVDR